MTKNCAICGNKIKLLDQNLKFKDGFADEKCFKKAGLKTSMSDITWASEHNIADLSKLINNGETINTKELAKEKKQDAKADKQDKIDKIWEQFKKVGVSDTFGTKKEIRTLPDILSDDETIKYATSGFLEANTVLMVCTNIRILFLDKGLVYGVKSTEIPLDMVNSVNYSKKIVVGNISIVNGAKTTLIEQVNKDTAPKMVDAIKQARLDYTNSSNQRKIVKEEQSLANKLRDLKSLLDEGIITEEEFSKKKKQLLNI